MPSAVVDPAAVIVVAKPAPVLQGDADCDLKDRVSLRAVDGRPGTYEVRHRKARYTMVAEETTTGAVRLRDVKADVVWLQIPTKSMLLNSKIGQRVADGCRLPEQQQEEARQQQNLSASSGSASTAAAGNGLGIAVVAR